MDSKLDTSDSEGEEEYKDEEVANPNLEWMTQGPLALLGSLHKMPKRVERMNIKFNPNSNGKGKRPFG